MKPTTKKTIVILIAILIPCGLLAFFLWPRKKSEPTTGLNAGTGEYQGTPPTISDPRIEELALGVIAGKYGDGDDRKAALGNDYDAVQARVNQLLKA